MLSIDGSFGEGGGQIIRTSLALSLITGKPFRVFNVRARREKPGLQRQHMTAVTAAAAIGGARVGGARAGAQEVTVGAREGRPRGEQVSHRGGRGPLRGLQGPLSP